MNFKNSLIKLTIHYIKTLFTMDQIVVKVAIKNNVS